MPDPTSCDLIADALGVDRDVVRDLAGHRSDVGDLDPDDPKRELTTLVNMLRLTDRTVGPRTLMRGWIDDDRKQEKEDGG